MLDTRPLSEPLTIAEWWKNRRGESIRLVLDAYQGRNVVDLRTWFTDDDGELKPGKGFACRGATPAAAGSRYRQGRSQSARAWPSQRQGGGR